MNSSRDYVVILHGIFRTSKHMQSLANFMADSGYEVLNLDYPSTKMPIEKLAEFTAKKIESFAVEDKPLHLIGYSMGGLVLRVMLAQSKPKNLHKVVMLATPNQGSEVADFLKNNLLYKRLYGVAGQQLITNQAELAKHFGNVDYDLGIIAGNGSIDPFCSRIIKHENDGKVSVASTKLEGMKDHMITKASHTFFPKNKTVHQQTLYFIKNGTFAKG